MIGYFDAELGRVQISPTIIRSIIMKEIEKNPYFRFPGTKSDEPVSRKILERNIRVNFKEGNVECTLILDVLYGTRIIKEARELQGKVTKAIQLSAGLQINTIAINVENVYEEEKSDEPLLIEHQTNHTMHENAVNQ